MLVINDWRWLCGATVVVIIIGAGLVIVMPAHFQNEAIQKIEGLGGSVSTEVQGPAWLRRLVGHDNMKGFDNVPLVVLSGSHASDHDLQVIRWLRGIRQLGIDSIPITDAALENLKYQTGIQELTLNSTGITDVGLREIQHQKKLQVLMLADTKITEDGLSALACLQ